jgi:hypothetical protein
VNWRYFYIFGGKLKTQPNDLYRAREKPPADLIEKLHDYNDMKDAGQALLGYLAQLEGTTTKQMYRKFGLNMDD